MKVIVSGWPGCGSTTLSIILAKILKLKLYRGTDSFRYFIKNLNMQDEGAGVVAIETLVQPYWGPIYDKYITETFESITTDNIIVDSDITGFLTGKKDDILSIFLHSSTEERRKHLATDKRALDSDILDEIDAKLGREYKSLYNLDFLNLNYVGKYYQLVLDNTGTPISEEVMLVLNRMKMVGFINESTFDDIKARIIDEEKFYWQTGKKAYIELLQTQGQIVTAEEIIKAVRERFPDEIAKFPGNLKNIVERIN
ncbi:MAG: hypothetical protein ABI721_05435 [Candidatus Dojkabacteria bacterium]